MTEQKLKKLKEEVNKTYAEFVTQNTKTDEYRDKWIRARIKLQDAEKEIRSGNDNAS